jgi:ankyrin repeat protein
MEQGDFFNACRTGNKEQVEQLCELNPELVNVQDIKGFTPLIIAVYNNQPEVVEILLQKGARPDMQDQAGNTALMGVCFKGYKELVPALLEAGAEVNSY